MQEHTSQDVDSSLSSQRFVGLWQILAQTSSNDEHAEEEPKRAQITQKGPPDHFELRWIDSVKPQKIKLSYSRDNGTLGSQDPEICISFWRHRSEDKIFALDLKAELLWSARRVDPEASEPDGRRVLNRSWRVRGRTGRRAPEGLVVLRELSAAGSGSPLGLYGLFSQGPQVEALYDILYFDRRDRSYNSIFGIRSLMFWLHDDETKDRLFAAYHTGLGVRLARHVGGLASGHVGELLSCESASLDDPDDPHSGCWTGEPPSGAA